MSKTLQHFGILGAGAFGTALAQALRRSGRQVTLWARDAALVQSINDRRQNQTYLPDIPLEPGIKATADVQVLAVCDALLLVTPAQYLREALQSLPPLRSSVPLVICAKGIERGTLSLLSAVVADVMPQQPVAVLSGPSFAVEVARGLPTAVTIAMADPAAARPLAEAIGNATLRPYLSQDVIGTQVGGAVKNVLALACGIVEGKGIGDNARAALITRGLSEMSRLGIALGGRAETFMGLSGLGDLVLTCTGAQSRNMTLGYALGQGRALADIMAERRSVAEGVFSAAAVAALAARYGIEMPICAAVHRILDQGAAIDDAIRGLLSRPLRQEGI